MSDPSSPTPGALPRRFDNYLGAAAALSFVALIGFIVTQCFPALRLSGDARFEIVLWLVEIGGVSAICFFVRPHIAHVHYAMEIGLHRGGCYLALADDHPRQLAARRIVWRAATAAAVLCWGLTAALEVSAEAGVLDLHGSNLHVVVELLSSAGTVGCLVRIIGPELAELDKVYRAARDHAARAEGLIPAQRPAEQPERHRAGF